MRYFILLTALFATTAAAGIEDQPPVRSISVSGVGEVEALPDAAFVSMAIEARHKDLQVARNQVDGRVTAFLKLVDGLGIERKHVQTAGLHVRPEYRWEDKTRRRYLDAYHVSRQLQVDLRDLDKLGALMTRAVQAGVNQVHPPQFRASNERELRRQALARAAQDARANARVLADTLGVKLGPVRSLQAQQNEHYPRPRHQVAAMRMEADSSAVEQSYEAGQIRLEASVNASFDIH